MTLATNVSDLAVRVATEFKTIRTLITGSGTGNIAGLTTTNKTSIVAAINEVAGGSGVGSASTTAAGIIEIATLAEVGDGTDSSRAVTPAGVAQATAAVRTQILGLQVPAALDTLAEFAAAINDDSNFAATVTASFADIGTSATNFVAAFEAGLTG